MPADDASLSRGSLSDPDWSTGPWETTCRTRLVRQRQRFDCGVACLAMAAGISYEAAIATFTMLGLGGVPRPFASNFAELQKALTVHGIEGRMLRWRGWDAFDGLGVLKVKPKDAPEARNWHWVVAEAHEMHGFVLRDPASPLVAFRRDPPLGVSHQAFDYLVPMGNWIRVDQAAWREPVHEQLELLAA